MPGGQVEVLVGRQQQMAPCDRELCDQRTNETSLDAPATTHAADGRGIDVVRASGLDEVENMEPTTDHLLRTIGRKPPKSTLESRSSSPAAELLLQRGEVDATGRRLLSSDPRAAPDQAAAKLRSMSETFPRERSCSTGTRS